MIKELVKIANKLDALGLIKEADALDGIIRKFAEDSISDEGTFLTPSEKEEMVKSDLEEKKKKERELDWSRFGLSDLKPNLHDSEGMVEKFLLSEENSRGKFNSNNGSYIIIPFSQEMAPKVFIAQGLGEGMGYHRSWSGTSQFELQKMINNLIQHMGYREAYNLNVPS